MRGFTVTRLKPHLTPLLPNPFMVRLGRWVSNSIQGPCLKFENKSKPSTEYGQPQPTGVLSTLQNIVQGAKRSQNVGKSACCPLIRVSRSKHLMNENTSVARLRFGKGNRDREPVAATELPFDQLKILMTDEGYSKPVHRSQQ